MSKKFSLASLDFKFNVAERYEIDENKKRTNTHDVVLSTMLTMFPTPQEGVSAFLNYWTEYAGPAQQPDPPSGAAPSIAVAA